MTSTPDQAVGLGMPQLPAPDYPADVRARLDADARELIARYPDSRSALLPLLHLVQAEEGYVSPDGIAWCAGQLGLTEAEVSAVTSARASPSCSAQNSMPSSETKPSSACTRCSSGSRAERLTGYRAITTSASASSRSRTSWG